MKEGKGKLCVHAALCSVKHRETKLAILDRKTAALFCIVVYLAFSYIHFSYFNYFYSVILVVDAMYCKHCSKIFHKHVLRKTEGKALAKKKIKSPFLCCAW